MTETQADGYTVLHPKTFDTDSLAEEQFALDVLMGLSEERKRLPSKYFYDAEGSRLFQEITDQKDYYPTECEREIFESHKKEIAAHMIGKPFSLVELGAGDGRKTKVLLREFLEQKLDFKYVPIDISEEAVRGLSESLKSGFGDLETAGIVAEYFDALRWLNRHDASKKFVLFLGSNIGNFSPPQTRVFLRTLWNSLEPGDQVLIGFDLKKDFDTLLRAYNDPAGVTKKFNLNLLTRMNRDLGADFDISKFTHFGTYDVNEGAMKSYLISLVHQDVRIDRLDKVFHFRPYEPIHMEYSYKYLPDEIEEVAAETGFRLVSRYFDEKKWFMDATWEVVKAR